MDPVIDTKNCYASVCIVDPIQSFSTLIIPCLFSFQESALFLRLALTKFKGLDNPISFWDSFHLFLVYTINKSNSNWKESRYVW